MFSVYLCLALFASVWIESELHSFASVRFDRIGWIESVAGLSDTGGFTQTGSGSNPGRNSILCNRTSPKEMISATKADLQPTLTHFEEMISDTSSQLEATI
jgi:hypothetical protein